MKIGVFGATGNTGKAVLKVAESAGHHVTVLVRDRQKIPEEARAALAKVVEGDVLKLDDVREVVKGQDGIVIALGTGVDLSPTTALSEGTKNVLKAMEELGVRRVSACLSGFLFFEPDKLPERFADLNADHQRMLKALKNSELEWVAVCPPHIADDPPKGQYDVAVEKSVGRRISKEDLADLLVRCLSDDQYVHKAIGIGYKN